MTQLGEEMAVLVDQDFQKLHSPAGRQRPAEIEEENIFVQQGNEVVTARLSEKLKASGALLEEMKTGVKENGLDDFGQEAIKNYSGGMHLKVPDNETISFDASFVLSRETFAVNSIEVGKNANLRMTFHFTGEGKWNAFTLIKADEGATIAFGETSTANGFVGHSVRSFLNAGASLDIAGVLLNQGRWRRDVDLLGEKASVTDHDVFFAGGDEVVTVVTNVNHLAPETTGRVWVQGICKDRAKALSEGLMKITAHAKQSDSFLSQHTLLLDKKAKADCVPDLEIENNDVKASHSASVSPVNQEHIFYLLARGLTKEEARMLVALGYLEPAIEKLPNAEKVRELVRGKWNA